MARPKKEPLSVIELSSDPLRFPGEFELQKKLRKYVDYYKTSRKYLPEYITLGADDLEEAKKSALKRKKVRVAPGVSFLFDGMPLVALVHLKKEG